MQSQEMIEALKEDAAIAAGYLHLADGTDGPPSISLAAVIGALMALEWVLGQGKPEDELIHFVKYMAKEARKEFECIENDNQ